MKKNLLLIVLFIHAFLGYSQASLVRDIQSGSNGGIDINSELFPYNNKVLFKANYGTFGNELVVSNGTNSGTEVIDINLGSSSSAPAEFVYNTVTNEVFFTAHGPVSAGGDEREIWKSNGFNAGTSIAHEFTPQAGWSSYPEELYESNGIVYCNTQIAFQATTKVGFTDGTTSNSGVVPSTSEPRNFFAFNGKLYFSAIDPSVGRQLLVLDGIITGASVIKVINSITSNSDPDDFIIFNNKLYFTADDGTHGRELWVTDGTTSGTQLVVDVNNGPTDSNIENLTVFGNKLYFSADSSNSGNEIHYITTTGSLILYKDINPGGGSSNPSNFKVFGGKLYFSANDGSNGAELWRADGSIFGIGLFKDINTTGASNPTDFEEYNGNLYFAANDGANGEELWMTDGTASGTVLVTDINPGSAGSEPRYLTNIGNKLLFHADNGTLGRELWKYVDPALSVDEFNAGNLIKVFPNPTTDGFAISDKIDVTDVLIYDVQGKLTKQFNSESHMYNIEDLSPGLYFVNIKANGKEETRKLVKK